MTADTEPRHYVAMITPDLYGFTVTCSCGYLVTRLPTMAEALTDQNAHIRRSHFAEDDAE